MIFRRKSSTINLNVYSSAPQVTSILQFVPKVITLVRIAYHGIFYRHYSADLIKCCDGRIHAGTSALICLCVDGTFHPALFRMARFSDLSASSLPDADSVAALLDVLNFTSLLRMSNQNGAPKESASTVSR